MQVTGVVLQSGYDDAYDYVNIFTLYFDGRPENSRDPQIVYKIDNTPKVSVRE